MWTKRQRMASMEVNFCFNAVFSLQRLHFVALPLFFEFHRIALLQTTISMLLEKLNLITQAYHERQNRMKDCDCQVSVSLDKWIRSMIRSIKLRRLLPAPRTAPNHQSLDQLSLLNSFVPDQTVVRKKALARCYILVVHTRWENKRRLALLAERKREHGVQ